MKVAAVILVIALALAAVLGYGFNNAANSKSYARETSNKVIATLKSFNNVKQAKTVNDNIKAFKDVNVKSAKATEDIKKGTAPKGTDKLKADSLQLLDILSATSDRAVVLFEYITTLQASSKTIRTKFVKTDDWKTIKSELLSLKGKVDEQLNRLRSSSPPPSLSGFHSDLLKGYSNLSSTIGRILKAVDAKQLSEAEDGLKDLSDVAREFTSIKMPTEQQLTQAIFPSEDQKKLGELADSIDKENSRIQSTFVVF